MLGAVAGAVSREGVEIEGAESVGVSFPGFYDSPSRHGRGESLTAADRSASPVRIRRRDRRDRRARRSRQEHGRAALAERLGFRYLDTGAMYREPDLARAAARPRRSATGRRSGSLARENPVAFDEDGRVFIDGTDVTDCDPAGPRSTGWSRSSPATPRCAR